MTARHFLQSTNRLTTSLWQWTKWAVPKIYSGEALPFLALLVLGFISSPLMPWYLVRLRDEASEPLGLLALITASAMLWRERKNLSLRLTPLLVGNAVILTLRFFGLASFPMILGFLVAATLAFSLRPFDSKPGLVALTLLSLPLMESLDFFGGYPLRLVAAELAQSLLNLLGMEVMRAGSLLRDGMNLIGVDPPCAGIHMLWTGWFVAAFLAARVKLSTARTLILLGGSTLIVVLGNSLRAVILFFPESGRVHWPHWSHEFIGLSVQGLILWAILAVSHRLADSRHPFRERDPIKTAPAKSMAIGRQIATAGTLAVLVFAAFFVPSRSPAKASSVDDNWPATMDGVVLERQPLTEREQRFTRGFSGSFARFRCGDNEVLLRKVSRATRTLHSSAECLRASGFAVRSRPVHEDPDGRLWGCFVACDGTRKWLVRERITSADGSQAFTDASGWIWEALLHPDNGPWLAVTVILAQQH